MGRVTVNNLQEGMVLEEDLRAPNGRFILGKGVTLKEKYIRMFKIWGITGADVEGVEDGEVVRRALLEEDAIRRSRSYVDTYFPPEDAEDVCASAVRSFCVRRFAEEFASGTPPSPLPEVKSLPRPPEGHFGRSFSAYALAKDEVRLFSFPDIYFKIQEVINSPISSATSIQRWSATIRTLPPVCSSLNSSFYGFPNPIQSIPERSRSSVPMNDLARPWVSTMKVFKNVPKEYVDMKSFWRHSIACGSFHAF